MCWFGNHKWFIDNYHFAEPNMEMVIRAINFVEKGNSVSGFDGILKGTTYLYFRCKKCGEVEERSVAGKYIPSDCSQK